MADQEKKIEELRARIEQEKNDPEAQAEAERWWRGLPKMPADEGASQAVLIPKRKKRAG